MNTPISTQTRLGQIPTPTQARYGLLRTCNPIPVGDKRLAGPWWLPAQLRSSLWVQKIGATSEKNKAEDSRGHANIFLWHVCDTHTDTRAHTTTATQNCPSMVMVLIRIGDHSGVNKDCTWNPSLER